MLVCRRGRCPAAARRGAQATLQFAVFLLASRHAPLHAEACAALVAARRVHERSACGGEWGEAVLASLTVPAGGTERPLRQVLEGLAADGSPSSEACGQLLA